MTLIPPETPDHSRFWFDTEFIEDGHTIELLSIGIVRDDGNELYLENSEADWSRANDWVKENVLTKLAGPSEPGTWFTRKQIAEDVLQFCGTKPEFWAYYADYDWVVLCQLFGRMIDLPKSWPMFCMDLKQVINSVGNPRIPKLDVYAHNALADAKWTRDSWMDLIHGDLLERRKGVIVFPASLTVRDALRLAHPVQSTAP